MNKVLFVVAGYDGIGLGHAFRVADLAEALPAKEVHILCTCGSRNAFDFLKQSGTSNVVLQAPNLPISHYVERLSPDVVINDVLDTSIEYIHSIKKLGVKTISFEDLGAGAAHTDLTINAIYEKASHDHVLSGHAYFDLRDEFIRTDRIGVRSDVCRILLSFGGEDRNNLSLRFLNLLAQDRSLDGTELHVVTGPAYRYGADLIRCISQSGRSNIILTDAPTNMADCIQRVDMAIASNGRTVYELAAIGVPSLVVAANDRELTHHFWNRAGFTQLGAHDQMADEAFLLAVKCMLPFEKRVRVHEICRNLDLKNGKKRVVDAITREVVKIVEAA
jgi:spore coat polysaccharide biosynthesis predicted glycosyltransferase SpsG